MYSTLQRFGLLKVDTEPTPSREPSPPRPSPQSVKYPSLTKDRHGTPNVSPSVTPSVSPSVQHVSGLLNEVKNKLLPERTTKKINPPSTYDALLRANPSFFSNGHVPTTNDLFSPRDTTSPKPKGDTTSPKSKRDALDQSIDINIRSKGKKNSKKTSKKKLTKLLAEVEEAQAEEGKTP